MTTGYQTFDRTTGTIRDCTPDELFDLAAKVKATQPDVDPNMSRCIPAAEKVRRDCRIAQLVGEMVSEGWDRRTATAIATEFAKAGA